MPQFKDIPQFTRSASYSVDVSWDFLIETVRKHTEDYNLNLDPDFQRAHVWDDPRRIQYVEFILRGGRSSRDLYFNCPRWMSGIESLSDYVLVDGKQRLHAVLRFLNNEIPTFGSYFKEYTDRLRMTGPSFKWHINDLASRAEVLQWYLDLNTGGVVHTPEELSKVRKLLEGCRLLEECQGVLKGK